MAPPQHKIDATLQAMEKAHRATADEQVRVFSKTINTARRDFESFATAEEAASQQNKNAGGSLLALVENERDLDQGLDRSLEKVKESLAEMERKRMLALGAMTRLSPEESLAELRKVKEHILNLSLRVPIRADFIVHGHNISLSIFRLFEAAERAEAEVDALINAKRSLDGGAAQPMNQAEVMSQIPQGEAPVAQGQAPLVQGQAPLAQEQTSYTQRQASLSNPTQVPVQPSTESVLRDQQFIEHPQVSYQQENYHSTEIDLGPLELDSPSIDTVSIHSSPQVESVAAQPETAPISAPTKVISTTPATTGMRLRRALQRSGQTSTRPSTSTSSPTVSAQPTPMNSSAEKAEDEAVFKGGDEEFDL